MEKDDIFPSTTPSAAQEDVFAQYAVIPEEAQAWLTHLGYSSQDMWELLDQEPDLAIPMGSHHIRMIAHVACSDSPVLLESLDGDRYAYGGGGWDVDEVREDAVAIKRWFSQRSITQERAQSETLDETTREEVLEALRNVDKGCTSPYQLEWYEAELDEDGAEVSGELVWAEGGVEAQGAIDCWIRQESERANAIGTHAAILEHFFDKATIWFDAGYCDPEYLEEVLEELLDIARVAEEKSLSDLLNRTQQKIDDINTKLSEKNN